MNNMIRAKFVIAISIFITASLFIGEAYSFFLNDFEGKYSSTGYWVYSEEEKELVKDMVISMTEEENLPVFSLKKESKGAFSRTVTIYANDAAKNILKDSIMQIKTGDKKSFFTGTTKFIIDDFDKAPGNWLREIWYPVDRDVVVNATSAELSEYSGGYVRYPMPDESNIIVIAAWIAVAIILLFLTWYDLVYSKKEQIVRIVLGADSTILMRDKIIKDVVSYSLAAIIAFSFMRIFTNTFFHFSISVICLLIFLGLNSILIVLNMGLSSKRIEIKSSNASKKTLGVSLSIKFVMGVLCVVVLSLAIGIAGEGKALFNQSDSYENVKDKARATIWYPLDFEKIIYSQAWTGEEGEQLYDTKTQLDDNFMRYAYKYLDCSTALRYSVFVYEEHASEVGDKSILANPNGLKEHKEAFPEWEYMTKNEGDYLLIPRGSDKEHILSVLTLGGTRSGFDGVYEYDADISVIAEEWQEPLEIKYSYEINKPFILLDTHDYTKLSMYPPTYELQARPEGEEYGNLFIGSDAAYIMQFSSVMDDEERIKEFGEMLNSEIIDPDMLDYNIVNLHSWYQELWGLIGRSMLIAIVLTILIFLLRSQITIIILNLEYEVNAQELTVKKVMGFSIYDRYSKIFSQTILLFVSIMIATIAIYFIFEVGIIKYLFAGCLIAFITDMLLMNFMIRRGDKVQISKVLKGGI